MPASTTTSGSVALKKETQAPTRGCAVGETAANGAGICPSLPWNSTRSCWFGVSVMTSPGSSDSRPTVKLTPSAPTFEGLRVDTHEAALPVPDRVLVVGVTEGGQLGRGQRLVPAVGQRVAVEDLLDRGGVATLGAAAGDTEVGRRGHDAAAADLVGRGLTVVVGLALSDRRVVAVAPAGAALTLPGGGGTSQSEPGPQREGRHQGRKPSHQPTPFTGTFEQSPSCITRLSTSQRPPCFFSVSRPGAMLRLSAGSLVLRSWAKP